MELSLTAAQQQKALGALGVEHAWAENKGADYNLGNEMSIHGAICKRSN